MGNENINSDAPKAPDTVPAKKRSKAPIILAIVIPVVAFLLIGFILLFAVIAGVFGFLHFRNKEATAIVETVAVTEALTEAVTEEATEAPTEVPTEAPTEALTQNEAEVYSYSPYDVEPYLVTLYAPTYIYDGPGYQYDCVMTLDEQGVYTIVKEQYNPSTYSTWGKLKSGVGWINLG